MKPLYIFDLDGTLALIDHRLHFVEGPKKDWGSFFKACVNDQPNEGVIQTLKSLLLDADIWIFTGRSDEVIDETMSWLSLYTPLHYLDFNEFYHGSNSIRMRRKGDYTPDEVLKQLWLDEMSPSDRERLVAVFEDRDRVVKMWRSNGVQCFQVSPGEF